MKTETSPKILFVSSLSWQTHTPLQHTLRVTLLFTEKKRVGGRRRELERKDTQDLLLRPRRNVARTLSFRLSFFLSSLSVSSEVLPLQHNAAQHYTSTPDSHSRSQNRLMRGKACEERRGKTSVGMFFPVICPRKEK